jgi:uncharacterized RDD family membrane protein YckC
MTSFREYREEHGDGGPIILETLPVAARQFQGDRAGLVIRSIAAVIDVVFIGFVIVLAWIGLWLFLLIFNPLVDYGLPRVGYFVLGGYFLIWAYWSWIWATNGRSLGQYLMGLRLLNRHGLRPGWKLATVRAAFCVVFPVGLLWAVVSRRNRSVQDVVLRTSVVHDWSSQSSSDRVAPLDEAVKHERAEDDKLEQRAERIADHLSPHRSGHDDQ